MAYQSRYLDDDHNPNHNQYHDGTPSPFSSSALLASLNLKSHNLGRSKRRKGKFSSHLDDIDSSDEGGHVYSESEPGSDASWTSSREAREAQLEWDEGIKQLQLAIQVLLFPFVGKWLGRKWSYWAFTRYQLHGGLSPKFFGLSWLWTPNSIIPDSAAAAAMTLS